MAASNCAAGLDGLAAEPGVGLGIGLGACSPFLDNVAPEGWDPVRYRFLTKPFGSTELAKTIDDLFDS